MERVWWSKQTMLFSTRGDSVSPFPFYYATAIAATTIAKIKRKGAMKENIIKKEFSKVVHFYYKRRLLKSFYDQYFNDLYDFSYF
jgi:hypothetical protein